MKEYLGVINEPQIRYQPCLVKFWRRMMFIAQCLLNFQCQVLFPSLWTRSQSLQRERFWRRSWGKISRGLKSGLKQSCDEQGYWFLVLWQNSWLHLPTRVMASPQTLWNLLNILGKRRAERKKNHIRKKNKKRKHWLWLNPSYFNVFCTENLI